jgi:hypothetical protein
MVKNLKEHYAVYPNPNFYIYIDQKSPKTYEDFLTRLFQYGQIYYNDEEKIHYLQITSHNKQFMPVNILDLYMMEGAGKRRVKEEKKTDISKIGITKKSLGNNDIDMIGIADMYVLYDEKGKVAKDVMLMDENNDINNMCKCITPKKHMMINGNFIIHIPIYKSMKDAKKFKVTYTNVDGKKYPSFGYIVIDWVGDDLGKICGVDTNFIFYVREEYLE